MRKLHKPNKSSHSIRTTMAGATAMATVTMMIHEWCTYNADKRKKERKYNGRRREKRKMTILMRYVYACKVYVVGESE